MLNAIMLYPKQTFSDWLRWSLCWGLTVDRGATWHSYTTVIICYINYTFIHLSIPISYINDRCVRNGIYSFLQNRLWEYIMSFSTFKTTLHNFYSLLLYIIYVVLCPDRVKKDIYIYIYMRIHACIHTQRERERGGSTDRETGRHSHNAYEYC